MKHLPVAITFSIALLVASFHPAQAAGWTTVGTDTYTTDNVGIGTTTPGYKLDGVATGTGDGFRFTGSTTTVGERDTFTVYDNDPNGVTQDESSILKVIRDRFLNDAADGYALLELTHNATLPSVDNRHFYMVGRAGAGSDEGQLAWGIGLTNADFWTQGSVRGGATGTDCSGTGADCFNSPTFVLSADSDSYINGGNLGIGTATPSRLLQLSGAASDIGLRLEGTATGADYYLYSGVGGSDKFGIYDEDAGADRLVVDSSGNIGIGTISPVYNLDLVSTGNTKMLIHANDATNDRYPELELEAGNSDAGAFSVLKFSKTAGSTTEKLEIQNGSGTSVITAKGDGNVGIGTIDPDDALSVYMPYIANADTRISLANDYVNMGMVGRSDSYGQFRLGLVDNTGAETMSLSFGNVGIGTGETTPTEKLDVQGNIVATGSICNGSGTCVGDSTSSGGVTGSGTASYIPKWNGSTTALGNSLIYDSGSSIGIGTASPAAFTTISTTATGDVFRVNDDGDGDSTPFNISGGGRVGIGTTDNTDNKVHMVWDESGGTTLVAENTIRDASNTTGIRGIVYASGNGSNGQPVGVRGDAENNSPSEGQYGVVGYNWATNQTSGLQGAGIFGGSLGTPGSEAEYTGRGHGVQGETYASNDNSAGGIFYSRHTTGTSADPGEANAITGITYSEDPDSYSFQGSGPTSTTGTKSAIVNTASQGPTELYVMESPEVWFEDIGEGKLVNGQVTINLDPIFLETITINDQHPLQVFVEPYANIDLYVERGQNSFTVKTKDNTTSNASFGYRIVAKRKHYEDRRLRKAKVPIDQFMEPGLTMDQLFKLNEQWGLSEAFQDLFLMHPSMAATTDSAVNVGTNL